MFNKFVNNRDDDDVIIKYNVQINKNKKIKVTTRLDDHDQD